MLTLNLRLRLTNLPLIIETLFTLLAEYYLELVEPFTKSLESRLPLPERKRFQVDRGYRIKLEEFRRAYLL